MSPGAEKALGAVKAAAAVVVPGAAVVGALWFGKILFDYSRTSQGTVNFPPPKYWLKILRLRKATQLMAAVARPTSVYRSGKTNELVGGEHEGAHTKAEGEDYVPTEGFGMSDVEDRARSLQDQGVFAFVLNEDDHIHTRINLAWRPASLI